MLVVYLFCKHKHVRMLVASLILHKIKEVEANSNSNPETNNYECRTVAYIGIILTVLSMIIVIFLHYRKSRLCRGYRFSNVIKIMLFISDVQNYIPIKLHKTSCSIHLFKIKGTLKSGDIQLNRNYLWDTLKINWDKITITFNDNKINLPKIFAIKMQDKIRVRRLMNREPLNLYIMIRQGTTWYNLETEIVYTKIYIFHISENGMFTSARMQLPVWFLQMQTPGRGGRWKSKDHIHAGDTHI